MPKIRELAAEYARAAFLAFPSTLEGFPLALLEGANFGLCPLVHSALPGVYDIVQDGETGIVTRPTVEAYAEGLRRLMADATLRQKMGEAARRFVSERYSRNRILDQWETLLRGVTDPARQKGRRVAPDRAFGHRGRGGSTGV